MKKTLITWALASAAIIGSVPSVYAANSITVFAAASLTNAMQTLAQNYEQKTGTDVMVSLASSSTLARQISQGAPADIYVSADNKWMNYVEEKGVMDNASRKELLTNSLVIVAPKNSDINHVIVSASWDLKSVLQGTRLAVGNPAYVPAGIYAKQSLEHFQLWKKAEPLLAPANNVRSALMLVENGEAMLGIVYKTDALIAHKVKIVAELPNASHTPIQYPMAMVKGHNTPIVQKFYQYLQSPAAQTVFQQYGFGVK